MTGHRITVKKCSVFEHVSLALPATPCTLLENHSSLCSRTCAFLMKLGRYFPWLCDLPLPVHRHCWPRGSGYLGSAPVVVLWDLGPPVRPVTYSHADPFPVYPNFYVSFQEHVTSFIILAITPPYPILVLKPMVPGLSLLLVQCSFPYLFGFETMWSTQLY
jgi:hypothetical protein